ncbi:MAG: DUF1549 domain-containing protein, partial [Pirellula sp.]
MRVGAGDMASLITAICTWILALGWMPCLTRADPPLVSIDSFIETDFDLLMGAREEDGLLLRRLSLDLRTVVPTLKELDEFLADKSDDRWTRWVDRFLDDPLHGERMVEWLDKTLMQRRPHKHVDRAKWLAYLRQVVDDRKPIDTVLKGMITSVWWNASERAAQRFFLDREGDPNGLSRDIGRVFFGRDMQCAQCHDHPQIDDYLQIDYHGLLAFFSPSALVEAQYKDDKGAAQKMHVYVERASGDAPFESVFDKGVMFRTGARIPGGTERIESFQMPDHRYRVTPLADAYEGVPLPPNLSRRQALVDELAGSHRDLSRNWANRIWAMMLGRGIVHPLDMHHADNPPTNPKLLDALASELVASGFNLRSLIRQIALSQTYQRAGRMPIESRLRHGGVIDLPMEKLQALTLEVRTCKQGIDATLAALSEAADEAKQAMDKAKNEWRSIQKERVAVRSEMDKAEAKFNEVKKKLDDSNNNLGKATKLRDDIVARIKLLEDAASNLEKARRLTPGEDPELAPAIYTATTKAESAKASLPESEKKVVDSTAARDALAASLETERPPLVEIARRMEPIEQNLHSADGVYAADRDRWRQSQSEFVRVQLKLASLNRVQAWLDASRSAIEAESKLDGSKQLVVTHQEGIAKHSMNLSVVQRELAKASSIQIAIESKRRVSMDMIQSQASEMETLQSTLT